MCYRPIRASAGPHHSWLMVRTADPTENKSPQPKGLMEIRRIGMVAIDALGDRRR